MKKKVTCFDLDGTLLPNTISGQRKVQDVLLKMNLPPVNPELIRKNWGKPFHDIAQIVCKAAGAAERYTEFLKIEHELEDQYVNLCSKLPSVLNRIKSSAHLAIVTSRSRKSFEKISQLANFDMNLFDFVQTFEDSRFYKPDPRVFDQFLLWVKSLGLNHSSVTYFGDTIDYDLAAVQGHPDIKFVGVCSGASKPSEFFSAGVIDVVDNTTGLAEYLERTYLTPVENLISRN